MHRQAHTSRFTQFLGRVLLSAIVINSAPGMLIAATDEDQSDLAHLRQELEQTRMELAEQARHLAELSRELAEQEGMEQIDFDFDFDVDELTHIALKKLDGDAGHQITEAIQQAFAGKPRLGVLLATADGSDARRVIALTPDSGAERAGIQVDDVIVKVNGIAIPPEHPQRMREALAEIEPGSDVKVHLLRDGEPLELTVQTSTIARDMRIVIKEFAGGEDILQDITSLTQAVMPEMTILPLARSARHFSLLGPDIDLIDNHIGLADYFGTAEGVLVLRVNDAHPLGLESGDVILRVAGESVEDPLQLGRMMLELTPGEPVTLEVMRKGSITQLDAIVPEHSDKPQKLRKVQRQRAHSEAGDDSAIF